MLLIYPGAGEHMYTFGLPRPYFLCIDRDLYLPPSRPHAGAHTQKKMSQTGTHRHTDTDVHTNKEDMTRPIIC